MIYTRINYKKDIKFENNFKKMFESKRKKK